MGTIKIKNTFEGGINFDVTPEAVGNNELRDATNIDIYSRGKYTKLTQLDGDSEILTYLQPASDLNILGAFPVRALYDYDGDLIYEQFNDSIIVFSYDSTNGSQITLIDQINAQVHIMYPNPTDNESLDFPTEGTISASFRQERSIPEIYWDDNKNPLRYMTLRWSASPLFQYPSLREITARRRLGGLQPELVEIKTGGQLVCGTYNFSFRFYNSTNGNSSAWSLFCNPIAIALENNEYLLDIVNTYANSPVLVDILLVFGMYDQQLGGKISQVANKKIVLDIPFQGDEYTFYDSIQLAVIKNIDGLAIPSSVAYITEPSKEWYDNHTQVEYTGSAAENVVDVSEIVTEDAAIKCAKTQVIKDNRLFRGNITYYDFKNDRGATTFDNATSIQETTYYKIGEETNWKKGYFHDEVYAYGIGYIDEYNNVGLVEPLDFGSLYWQNRTNTTTTIVQIIPQYEDIYVVELTSVSGLEVGDYMEMNGNIVQVADINTISSTVIVKGNPGATISSTAYLLYGQKGNQANNWSWKFPKRSDNQYTILDDNSNPQAMGLRITGIKNYPSWAKGAVIVRQKRKKNILYQMPHIPTVGVMGVPTQGIGPITFDKNDPYNLSLYNDDKADYEGQFDCIAPKVMGLGMAKNIAKWQKRFTWTADDRYYVTFYPFYANHLYNFSDDQPLDYNNSSATPLYLNNLAYGAEIPKYVYGLVPEYIFNNNGEPTISNPINGGEYFQAVDAVALKRNILKEVTAGLSTSNVYKAIRATEYMYRRNGLFPKNSGNQYFIKPWNIDVESENIPINKAINLTLGQPQQLLDDKPFESVLYENIELWGSVEELSNQQGAPNAIPTSTWSFFNVTSNQRAMLMNTNKGLIDFTYYMNGNTDFDLFPSLTIPTNINGIQFLEQKTGLVEDDAVTVNAKYEPVYLPNANIFAGNNDEYCTGAWILNVYNGLSDDRYNKISTDWVSTGSVHYFTEADRQNNTPFDIDIWGGDCFVTKATMKVNNNTQRISNIYDNIQAEADDYETNKDKNFFGMYKNAKTGSYENNVEFIQIYLESEINTDYYQQANEYPSYVGTNIGNYSKPYLFQYNGSYSVNNDYKTFVTQETDIKDTKGRFPARIVWSDQSLYQAQSSALVETNGLIRFRVLARKDFDEKYGEITGLVDFGDTNIHTIQQYKVRVDPVGRNIIQQATEGNLVVLGESVVGNGGYYISFDNGSQHMRTIKYYSGTAFMVDAQKKQVVIFGAGGSGFKVISQDKANAYFDVFLDSYNTIREIDLAGYIDYTNDKQEYTIVKFGDEQKGIIFNTKTNIWKSKIDTGDDLIHSMLTSGEYFYRISKDKLYRAYAGPKGFLLGAYRDSKFSFVLNDYAGFTKRFSVVNFEMQGSFRLNLDEIYATSPQYNPNYAPQVSGNLLAYNAAGVMPPPYGWRNYAYWLNKIRDTNNAPMRGDYLILDFTIKNDDTVGAINIMSTSTDCESAYRNR
jgi:hypothetical protein